MIINCNVDVYLLTGRIVFLYQNYSHPYRRSNPQGRRVCYETCHHFSNMHGLYYNRCCFNQLLGNRLTEWLVRRSHCDVCYLGLHAWSVNFKTITLNNYNYIFSFSFISSRNAFRNISRRKLCLCSIIRRKGIDVDYR